MPARLLLAVLLTACLLTAPSAAQVTVSPDTVAVTLHEGEAAEVTLTVSNAGSGIQPLALSLAQAPSTDDPPEPPGTTLFTSEETCCGLDNITSTPDGRLFVTTNLDTYEFSPELQVVNEFRHPISQQIRITTGIAYDTENNTLWWLDAQGDLFETEQAMLLEATLNGTETGGSLTVPYAENGWCGFQTGKPSQLAYSASPDEGGEEGRFYYLDVGHEEIWAMDVEGETVEGYPVALTGYLERFVCFRNPGLDAHALSGETVLETGIEFGSIESWASRVVVTDLTGHNRGVETPLRGLETPDGYGSVLSVRGVVRSRLDPSILYITVLTGFAGDVRYWVYAVRAAPLPPVWLHGAPILFEVEGNAETDLTLTLDASGLEPGVYEAVASVREGDGIGPVLVDVPVVLTVAEPVAAEEAAERSSPALSVYPNPARSAATLRLVLPNTDAVRLAVYDVTGREVAVAHDGPLAAGEHIFSLDPTDLTSGVYLVRATGSRLESVQTLTVVR